MIEDVRSTSPKAGHNELLNSSVDMDGEGLRSLFRGNVEDTLVKNNVAILLKSSSKPADLVFYVIQGLHSSISGKDGSSSELGILVKGPILLLKELKSFSFILDPQLHARATKFSRIYKSSLKAAKNNYMGVICLLQFLDVYKVPHNADEVISLLDPSIWCKEVPHSCKRLGLQDFIPSEYLPRYHFPETLGSKFGFSSLFPPLFFSVFLNWLDFIKSLIQKNQRINALKYIHAMELESTFVVAAILKNHLAHWEKKADGLLKGQNVTLPIQVASPYSSIQTDGQFLPFDFHLTFVYLLPFRFGL